VNREGGSWLRRFGVLGMNGRNAGFLLRCNPRRLLALADDKLQTKRLAARHGIPIPRLLHVVERQGDIRQADQRLADQAEFVVKPARGSGGSGILLITGRARDGYIKQDGGAVPVEAFRYHLAGILSGIHSLDGLEDCVVIEALLHPDPVFAAVTHQGVPDIRLIVYRGVPVMGMVRLPTRASDGKANLHRGAIGAGIGLREGRTLSAVQRTRVVTHHPDTGSAVRGIAVPQWDRLLWFAARTCELTGLGYLGADWVLDAADGPVLLELNARPGLAIQLANQAGLWERLDAVDRAPPEALASPEARVAWAKDQFR
jgi:alpha-L-glutamate ligase-like protein